MALLDAIKKLFGGGKKEEVSTEEAPAQEEVNTEAPVEEVVKEVSEESSEEVTEETKEY